MGRGRPKKPHTVELGRCITVARVRAGYTLGGLAEKIFYTPLTLRHWEKGRRAPDWELLESVLPELAEIRARGVCTAYCPKAESCADKNRCGLRRPRCDGGLLLEEIR